MFCQKCNAQNQNDAVFCTKCGARLYDENYNSEETDEILYRWDKENKGSDEIYSKTPKSTSKNLDYVFRSITVKVILIGLLIFVAIVSITIFVTSPDKKHDNKKVNATLQSTTTTPITIRTTTTAPKTTATTTTPKTTTTTAAPKMPYNMGEEITITSTVDRISDELKTIYVIADNVTWSINCKKVEGFNKLTTLCGNKNVKFIGNVSDDFEITLTSVIINNQTYNVTDFSLYPTVYEDENVKIQYYEVGSYMGHYDSVIFRVTNKRDFQITIQCDSISLDGIQIDGNPTMSDEVAPKSTAKVYARYHDGVDNKSPTKISGNLRVIDFDYNNKHFDSYDATFVNIAI